MTKKKPDKKGRLLRQTAPWFDRPEGFDSWAPTEQFNYRMKLLEQMRNSEFYRANEKVCAFINNCVTDPDFRHADSKALLDLLLIVRDQLLSDESSSATKEWGLDDYLKPIQDAKLAWTRRMKDEKECEQKKAVANAKKYVQDEWEKVKNKRAQRAKFSDRMASEILEKFGVQKASPQITKNWLKGS